MNGKLCINKSGGWGSLSDSAKVLGEVLESGLLTTYYFYPLFNPYPLSNIMTDFTYNYMDPRWGGTIKGFQHWSLL